MEFIAFGLKAAKLEDFQRNRGDMGTEINYKALLHSTYLFNRYMLIIS